MSLKHTLLAFSLLAGAHASPLADPSKPEPSKDIAWKKCDLNGTLPVKCGELPVPLDYTDKESDKTLNLQLAKIEATKKPRKGSILFNFGGPGVGARTSLAGKADILQGLTGGHYDLIAHDPRGTEDTLTFSCFKSPEESAASHMQYRFSDLITAKDKSAMGRLYASATNFGETCAQFPDAKKRGELISTAFTARDLMEIVDVVEKDKKLRFWGSSYGTVVGSTVAAMFPERIERLILDGVMNPHEYYNAYDIEIWSDTDATFSEFFKECIKAPKLCPLARKGATAAKLEDSVWELLDGLKERPLAHKGAIIDHSVVRLLIRPTLYNPSKWSTLAVALDALLQKNLTAFTEVQQALQPPWASEGASPEAPFGIPCSEKVTGKDEFDQLMPEIERLDKRSRLLGQTGTSLATICSQWPYEAKERYEGDFKVKTKNPMLVIGNSFDPATPLRSARNITSAFEDSVLLEHGGYGHCSSQQASVCTGKAIKNYFNDGSLPKKGTVCKTAYPPFEQKSWKNVLDEI